MSLGRRRHEREGSRPVGRVLRGLLPDRNPLRRTCDRVETYLLAGLFVASAAAAPFAAQAASQAAYAGALRAQHAEQAATHLVPAELTQLAAPARSTDLMSTYVQVQATWVSVTGVRHTGQLLVPAGSRKGSTFTVWTDAAGNLVSAPLLASQVAGQGDLAATGVIAGLGALYLCEAAFVRLVVNRRRLAAWEADWVVTARVWNRQRW